MSLLSWAQQCYHAFLARCWAAKTSLERNGEYMGLSENSVPLNPMVLLIIIPFLNGYFIGNINPTFSDKSIFQARFLIVSHVQKSVYQSRWACQQLSPGAAAFGVHCKITRLQNIPAVLVVEVYMVSSGKSLEGQPWLHFYAALCPCHIDSCPIVGRQHRTFVRQPSGLMNCHNLLANAPALHLQR